MNIAGQPTTSIRVSEQEPLKIEVIDQRLLPHALRWEQLDSCESVRVAIKDMHVRGAPLIGATAAFGVYLAAKEALDTGEGCEGLWRRCELLASARPTAVNLEWAVLRMKNCLAAEQPSRWLSRAAQEARAIANEDVEQCRAIGQHGKALIEAISQQKHGKPVNILTHCNAGWLACVDYGTATSPIYQAHDAGIKVHVWVDETRPRNQGAKLTAWELLQHGVPHTVIPDNTGGHLMQHGLVDMCIVGSDRVTRRGDVANKIGTYLKALAAKDNNVPFYVAFPSTTLDWSIADGLVEVPIELRDQDEVTHIDGWDGEEITTVQLTPTESQAANYGFDVTPSRLVTGLITERGICEASEQGLIGLFPEHQS